MKPSVRGLQQYCCSLSLCLPLFLVPLAHAADAATTATASPASGIVRTVSGQLPLTETAAARDIISAEVSIAAGAQAGWHVHPGEEISRIIEGESWLLVAGHAPRLLKAGDSFMVPAGVPHAARNEGKQAVKLFAVYVVERGKPMASPANPPDKP